MGWLRIQSSTLWRTWAPEVQQCIQRSRYVYSSAFVIGAEFMLSNMILEPSFRSRVTCHTAPLDLDPAPFTGSATCGDRSLVIQHAVKRSGLLHAVQGLISVASIPLLGAYSDRHGRLPVLYLAVAGHLFWLCIMLSCAWSMEFLLLAFVVRGLTQTFFPTWHSILGDHGGNRSVSFTIKIICAQLGHAVGWMVGLPVLRNELLDYSGAWLICLVIFGAGMVLLRRVEESLPARQLSNQTEVDDVGSEPSAEQPLLSAAPFQQLLREPFFARYCVSKFFLVFGASVVFLLKSFVLSAYEWPQGRLESIYGFAGVIGVLSTLCGPALVRRTSIEIVLRRCVLAVTLALSLLTLAPISPVFCLSAVFLVSSSACVIAADTTLMSERFPGNQGKAQSIVMAIAHVASSTAHLLYSLLYDAKAATDLEKSLPFLLAASCSWCGYGFLLTALGVASARKGFDEELGGLVVDAFETSTSEAHPRKRAV